MKENTGQTLLHFDQKACLDQKSKFLPCFLNKILLKEKSAEPDQIKLALLLKKKWSELHWKNNTNQTVLSLTKISWKY